jgi:hypothetical protein
MKISLTPNVVNYLVQQRTDLLSLLETEYTKRMRPEAASISNHLQHLGARSTILDVGAGIGGLSLMLSKTLQSGVKFVLLDKDGDHGSKIGWHKTSKDFGAYNSSDDASAFLRMNGMKFFEFANADDGEPSGPFDAIISTYSWGFHYPLSTYSFRAPIMIMDIRDGYETLPKDLNSREKIIISQDNKTSRILFKER